MVKLPDIQTLAEGVRARDRASLGRAITLVESTHPTHRAHAQDLLAALSEHPDVREVAVVGRLEAERLA